MEEKWKEKNTEGTERATEESPASLTRRKFLEMGAWSVPVILALAAGQPNKAYAQSGHTDGAPHSDHSDAHNDAHSDHWAAPIFK